MGDMSNSKPEAVVTSSGLLGWMEQNLHKADLVDVLRQYLPDFGPEVLADSRQRALTEQKLSGLHLLFSMNCIRISSADQLKTSG